MYTLDTEDFDDRQQEGVKDYVMYVEYYELFFDEVKSDWADVEDVTVEIVDNH